MNKKNNRTIGERMAILETNMAHLIATINGIKTNDLVGIDQKLNELFKIYNRRLPLWAHLVITFFTSACIGLIVLYLSTIGKI